MLSDRSQTEGPVLIPFVRKVQRRRVQGARNWIAGCRQLRGEKWGLVADGLGGWEGVLKFSDGDGCAVLQTR